MSAQIASIAPLALAFAAIVGMGVLALVAMWSRVLFSIVMAGAAIFVLAALAALALGAPLAALSLGVLGVGVAPVVFLGAVLLTGRSARARAGRALATPAALAAIAAVVVWMARDVMSTAPLGDVESGIAIWIGALAFAAGAGAFALLGFGERGGFERLP